MATTKCSISKAGMIKNLSLCLNSEEKALDLYQELLPLLEDKTDIIKIKYIIKDEVRHVGIVKELIRLVNLYYEEK